MHQVQAQQKRSSGRGEEAEGKQNERAYSESPAMQRDVRVSENRQRSGQGAPVREARKQRDARMSAQLVFSHAHREARGAE